MDGARGWVVFFHIPRKTCVVTLDDHEDGVTMASRRRRHGGVASPRRHRRDHGGVAPRHGVAATPASSSSFTTRSRGPVDRLVAVKRYNSSALVAVDAPAKVDVVAERAAPVFFWISGTMRRVRPLLREQRPQPPSSPVPLRVLLFDLRLRQTEFDRGADVLGNRGLMDVAHLSRLGPCTSIAPVAPRIVHVVTSRAAPVPRDVSVRPGVLAQFRLRVTRPRRSRFTTSFALPSRREVEVLATFTNPVPRRVSVDRCVRI